MNSLKRRSGFELTSSPTLTVRQGEKGKIQATRDFIFPTEYIPPQFPRERRELIEAGDGNFPVTPATPSEFESVDIGVISEFKARQTPRNEIAFEIALTHRSFQGFINYGSPITAPATNARGGFVEVTVSENRIEMPVIHTKHIRTAVTMADGHYLALGGLRMESNRVLSERVKVSNEANHEDEKNLFALIAVKSVDAQQR